VSADAATNVVAYLRVSTDEQARSGLGLDAQRRVIAEEAERRGWEVRWIVDDGYSARDLNRPGWREVEAALKRREASVVVVAKLDRLSRSVHDFAGILSDARRQKWGLVVLDVGMDFTTPQGKAWAQMVAVFAELERELIGQRTRDAMAEAKARGVTFGRKRSEVWQPELVARVLAEREAGASYKAIAAGLDRDGIPRPKPLGNRDAPKRWYPSTVRRLVLVELPAEVA